MMYTVLVQLHCTRVPNMNEYTFELQPTLNSDIKSSIAFIPTMTKDTNARNANQIDEPAVFKVGGWKSFGILLWFLYR